MASQMRAPALDLSTDTIRPFVRIDQLDYDVRLIDDFSALEAAQLDKLLPRVVPLARKLEAGTVKDTECKELSALLDSLLTLALAAPEPVRTKLGDIQKVKIFHVFMTLLPQSLVRARALMEAPQHRSRGAQPSRRSNGSMAAASTRGRRRSHSG